MENNKVVCGCYKVTKDDIIEAVKNGADTVEKAGTGCGRCKGKIQEIIDIHSNNNKKKKGFFARLFGL